MHSTSHSLYVTFVGIAVVFFFSYFFFCFGLFVVVVAAHFDLYFESSCLSSRYHQMISGGRMYVSTLKNSKTIAAENFSILNVYFVIFTLEMAFLQCDAIAFKFFLNSESHCHGFLLE